MSRVGPLRRTLIAARARRILACLALTLVAPVAFAATNPNGVAVIIGNKAYTGRDVPEVKYADRDAQAMKRYVIDVLGYDEKNIIYVENAPLSRMLALFGTASVPGQVARWVRRDGTSDLFVYYSGHGVPGLSDGQSYLLPVDGDPAAGEINGYPLKQLYANLETTKARKIVVVLDACFAGQSGNGASLIHNASLLVRPADPAPKQVIPRLTIVAASGANEVANWDDADRHGLFTEYFLRAVYGAADASHGGGADESRITMGAVHRYLDNEMTYFAGRELGRDQNASVSGDDSLVLAAFAPGHPPTRTETPPPPSPAVPAPAIETDDAAWPETDRRAAQSALLALGHYRGAIDGDFGAATRAAIRQWQGFADMDATGRLSADQRDRLLREAAQVAALLKAPPTSPRGTQADSVKGAETRFNRGAEFENGTNRPKDFAEAAYWYALAAGDGWAAAYTNLATLRVRAQGFPKADPDGARSLWLVAAALGEGTALFNLGALAESGIGGHPDLAAARRWYARGAEQKNTASAAALKRLGN